MVELAETTKLERENLEAHVDLCAMRYQQLDTRLTTIEKKVSELGEVIADNKNSLAKVIITASGTIVASILGLIATLLMK